jgi:twitching motility protein PilT
VGSKNRREQKRLLFRETIEYQKKIKDDKFDVLVMARARDIGVGGISFFSFAEVEVGSILKITLFISQSQKLSLKGKVARVLLTNQKDANYIVGVDFKGEKPEIKEKLKKFVARISIESVLSKLDLKNVVDIHLVTGYPPILKKGDRLLIAEQKPLDAYLLRNLLFAMLSDQQYQEFNKYKECNFILNCIKKRFRVNFHLQRGKVEGVLRIIPSNVALPFKLGLPPVTETFLANKKGLILVSGRTGSGKTTTLASMVEFLNERREGIIICVEAPVEYLHANRNCIIKQREVGKDTLSFANAAKNALRQNPDVLVLGEILDKETMEVAITAAETGTLVLTSIHAGSAAQALDRVASFFPADMQIYILRRLSLVLKGAIAQDLIPRKDNNGFALATEVLVVDNAIRRVIRDGDWKQVGSLIQMGKKSRMQTMRDSLWRLYRNQIIDEEYIEGEP